MEIVSVSITGPEEEWLAGLARKLVEERLAACGNLFPAVRSIYRWQGAVEEGPEAYLLLHTRAEHVPAIIERTNAEHPYDTVQILATRITAGDPDYCNWVVAETAPHGTL